MPRIRARYDRVLLAPIAALALAVLISACATAGASPSPSPSVTDSPSVSPSPSPSADPTADPTAEPTDAPTGQPTTAPTDVPAGAVVVTLAVGDEQYRILLTDPEHIENARQLLAGDPDAHRIPNGLVVREPSPYNPGYEWHIDPDNLQWVDITMELCDGRPSDVSGAWETDRYCPWGAEVIAVDEVN